SGFAGDDWISFTVSNGSDEATGMLIIHVTNTAPTVTSNPTYNAGAGTTYYEMFYLFPYYAYDADGDTLTVTAVNDDPDAIGSSASTTHGSVHVYSNGYFDYTPDANFTGDDTFTVSISDGIEIVTMTITMHVS